MGCKYVLCQRESVGLLLLEAILASCKSESHWQVCSLQRQVASFNKTASSHCASDGKCHTQSRRTNSPSLMLIRYLRGGIPPNRGVTLAIAISIGLCKRGVWDSGFKFQTDQGFRIQISNRAGFRIQISNRVGFRIQISWCYYLCLCCKECNNSKATSKTVH